MTTTPPVELKQSVDDKVAGRKPIGYVEAVVRLPLYEGDGEGDRLEDGSYDWFEYRQPGIKNGRVGECRRPVTLVSHKVVRF